MLDHGNKWEKKLSHFLLPSTVTLDKKNKTLSVEKKEKPKTNHNTKMFAPNWEPFYNVKDVRADGTNKLVKLRGVLMAAW